MNDDEGEEEEEEKDIINENGLRDVIKTKKNNTLDAVLLSSRPPLEEWNEWIIELSKRVLGELMIDGFTNTQSLALASSVTSCFNSLTKFQIEKAF